MFDLILLIPLFGGVDAGVDGKFHPVLFLSHIAHHHPIFGNWPGQNDFDIIVDLWHYSVFFSAVDIMQLKSRSKTGQVRPAVNIEQFLYGALKRSVCLVSGSIGVVTRVQLPAGGISLYDFLFFLDFSEQSLHYHSESL